MKKSILFISLYFLIFLVVSVPLFLNIKINELSNNVDELETQVFNLEKQRMLIKLQHNENYSISSIEKLSKTHFYERLEISQKINKLEIPYKLKKIEEEENISILGFGR